MAYILYCSVDKYCCISVAVVLHYVTRHLPLIAPDTCRLPLKQPSHIIKIRYGGGVQGGGTSCTVAMTVGPYRAYSHARHEY